MGQLLDVAGDVERLDARQGEPVSLAPCQEIANRLGVGPPRVAVADGGGKELDETPGRVVARLGDDGREDQPAAAVFQCYSRTRIS